MNVASIYSAAEEEQHEEALHHYEQALALRAWPPSLAAQAEYNSAICLHALGRADDARAALGRAQQLSPDFAPAAELAEQLEQERREPPQQADDGGSAPGEAASPEEESGPAEQGAAPSEAIPRRQQWRSQAASPAGATDGAGARSSRQDLLDAIQAAQRQVERALAAPRDEAADTQVAAELAQLVASGGQYLARELRR